MRVQSIMSGHNPHKPRNLHRPGAYLARAFPLLLLTTFILSGCVNLYLKDVRKPLRETTIAGEGRSKVLVMELSGFISGEERREGLIAGERRSSLTARVKEELEKAAEDERVRALVLRINSPGGLVTASDTIYHEIRRFQEQTGRPVIASIMDLGTSGAYYIALAADRIIAQPTTVTGSIGVIMVRPDIEGLLDKLGIRTTEIKSGEMKAMGSPFRPISPEERKIFQDVIDEMYERFVAVLLKGRPHLGRERALELADGRIYTARQARDAGLVDAIGYLSDAIDVAKQLTGVDEARVIMYHRPGEFRGSIYAMSPVLDSTTLSSALTVLSTPQFMYLWMP